jgi:uncharacterized protein YjbI with pentapeptide repeats
MSDTSQIDTDAETPVNPYSLLEAVNRSSDTAHTAWLIFLGVMAYLMIAVAGVTHKQLLLQKDVQLPILNVNIPQVQFFQFAPVFLLLFHFGLISQLALLARKTLEFDMAVRHLEPTARRTHPLRLELHNFFFVQGIAGPHRSAIMSLFLHSMSWLTLAVLPVVLLLFIQLSFLPYHDSLITWTHRVVLVLDIIVLILIGVFLMRAETSFFRAFWRTSIGHPISFLMTTIILVAVAFFSFAVATIPGKLLDRTVKKFILLPAKTAAAGGSNSYLSGFAVPLFWGSSDGSLFGFFHRNLIVRDVDLVADREVSSGEPSLTLRGRDLRYAQLDRSDLHQADFTGTRLDGASLIGANLTNVRLSCGDENELLFGAGREKAQCASARGANFLGAKLAGANLTGIDLSGSKLENAQLEGAVLRLSVLEGTNFSNANLRKADLTAGVLAQGAVFLVARLEGADLNGAQLQYADFSSAQLQAVSLAHAQLQGAILRDALLAGANLYKARLHGADLTGADLVGADLREAGVWLTVPPSVDKIRLADLRGLVLQPMSKIARQSLLRTVQGIGNEDVRRQVEESLKPLLSETADDWTTSQDYAAWQSLMAGAQGDSTDFRSSLTVFLEGLICKARWADGSVAHGVARRAKSNRFEGDMPAILLRLQSKDAQCRGASQVEASILLELAASVDERLGR